MKSSKNWEKVVGRVYDNVEAALWAALLAFVIYFINARVQEIAAENALYCEKFGMKVGTEKHKQCLLDLGEFRTKVEKRVYDQSVF